MSYYNYDYHDLKINEPKEYNCFINLNSQWWNRDKVSNLLWSVCLSSRLWPDQKTEKNGSSD